MTTKSTATAQSRDGWMQSSTCRAVDAAGKAAGREYGLAETTARELVRLLERQAKQKFAGADPAGHATLDGLSQAFAVPQLEELADRILTAASWAEWLAGVVVPSPAPGMPEYTKDLTIDFEPSGPGIDLHMEVGMKGGGEGIVHVRMQKWYQPDLDRYLFRESQKRERKFGKMPTVCVILLWPPAEGPGMTGRYEERDAKGRLKHLFTYTIRRAWEMEPEEATKTVGALMFAPLTRGARQRMPEIMDMVEKRLALDKIAGKDEEMVWEAVYWSMGLICDLDEAHRALGERLAIVQRSRNYLVAKGEAFLNGYSAVQSEGPQTAARGLVLRQATRRFGEWPGATDALAAITALEELEALAARVLTASDWSSLLAKP